MFERKRNGKREQFKEENKGTRNTIPNSEHLKELKVQFEDAVKHKTAICPVTFVSDENSYIKNNGLTDYPLNYQALLSSVIMKNPEISLGQIANLPEPERAFYNLDMGYSTITVNSLEFHIIQSAFTNFCNKINYASMNGLVFLQYIPLAQFVYEELNSDNGKYGLYRLIPYDIMHGKNSIDQQKTKSVKQIDSYMMYLKNIAMQISLKISSAICIACDKAINDILQVHYVPNIEQIYDCISTQNNVLRNKFKNHDSDFPAYAAIFVKEVVRNLISELIEDNILDMAFKALVSLSLTGYEIYDEYARKNDIFKSRKSEYEDDF